MIVTEKNIWFNRAGAILVNLIPGSALFPIMNTATMCFLVILVFTDGKEKITTKIRKNLGQ